jgi:hypothetical protein
MVFIERNECEDTCRDRHLILFTPARRNDVDLDAKRGAALSHDLCINRYDIADEDGGNELHRLDRDCGAGSLGNAACDDAACYIHLAEHPATKDMAV